MTQIDVSMRTAAVIALLSVSPFATSEVRAEDEDESKAIKRPKVSMSQLWRTRPQRKDEPLREENISDNEVREIEALMKRLFPGSIVYISPVTAGCPCQDGTACDSQVWSVANRNDRSKGISLSRVDGKWEVGPLQQWWLTYERLMAERSAALQNRDTERPNFHEFNRRLQVHIEAFPFCAEQLDERRLQRGKYL